MPRRRGPRLNTDPPLLAPETGIEGAMIRVSTRRGGISPAPWDSLNLGDHVGDQPAHVSENRRRLQRAMSVPAISWLRQVHGTRVIKAVDGTRHEADAQWTEQRGRALAILTADCLPVVLIAEDARCVGIAHAGWRGLAGGVIEALISEMPVAPDSLVAWLGPSIGRHVYEVGPEVRAGFDHLNESELDSAFLPSDAREGHWLADLPELARGALCRAGVTRVMGGQHCSYTQVDQYFSHRRDGYPTGRMATLVWRT